MQPLSGLLVVDFTTLLPGPLATLMLAEAGAEVIKIEQPGGENARRFPPMIDGESAAAILSDDTIVERLREAGIDIARRTVAKYREDMRIPSTHQRRVKK